MTEKSNEEGETGRQESSRRSPRDIESTGQAEVHATTVGEAPVLVQDAVHESEVRVGHVDLHPKNRDKKGGASDKERREQPQPGTGDGGGKHKQTAPPSKVPTLERNWAESKRISSRELLMYMPPPDRASFLSTTTDLASREPSTSQTVLRAQGGGTHQRGRNHVWVSTTTKNRS